MKINLQSIISFIACECAKQRNTLFLWVPVMMGIGITLYFKGNISLSWTGISLIISGLSLAIYKAWKHYDRSGVVSWLFFLLTSLAFFFIIFGFALSKNRDETLQTRILEKDFPILYIKGTIEKITQSKNEKAKRVILNNIEFEDLDYNKEWKNIRVRLHSYHFKGDQWNNGDHIRVKAKLRAPSPPVIPGGFNFREKAYFEGLSAVGYTVEDASKTVHSVTKTNQIQTIRDHINTTISQFMSPQNAAISQALLTGERTAISKENNEFLRTAGLAHLLAISGLHVGLVAGCVFFFIRLFLATIPSLALYYPIKKWAAMIAIIIAFSYMILAGTTVPTIRAFIMTSLVLLAIILDRSAINMRLVALSAIVIMLLTPEAILGPSFVLSFAAVAGLISFYQNFGRKWLVQANAYTPFWRPVYYLFGIILTTIVATFATAPFAILFFNRFAVYGVLSNILAMPIMSFIVMPSGLISILLLPIDLSYNLWPVMEWGIEKIILIAQSISAYPHANLYAPSFNNIETFLTCFGFLWFLLWQGHFRWIGLICILISLINFGSSSPERIIISDKMESMFIVDKDVDNIYEIGSTNRYIKKQWLNHLGKNEAVDILSYKNGDKLPHDIGICDDFKCILHIHGIKTHIILNPIATYSSCKEADIIIIKTPLKKDHCDHPQLIIDRFYIWRNGATLIEYNAASYRIKTVKDNNRNSREE